jgi:hypothetical protein
MMLSLKGARQISGNRVTISILIQQRTSNAQRPTSNDESDAENLLDNFEDSALAVARSRTSQQRANRLNRLATPANHSADIPMSKLQLEDGSPAIWNFRQHHVIGKLNQLANHKLQKLPHAFGRLTTNEHE